MSHSAPTSIHRGHRLHQVLYRRWHGDRFAADPDGLDGTAAAILNDGLSGWVWDRLSTPCRRTTAGRDLRRAAFEDAAMAIRLDAELVKTIRTLRQAGVEPIVTKGWAVARYYASPTARPYSDLDLAICPEDLHAATAALNGLGLKAGLVDLHVGLPDLPGRTWAEVLGRSILAPLDGYPVRVLAPEDQFRWLVVHLVRHTFDRPRGLLDLAVMLDGVGLTMDWDLCLRGSFAWRRWTLAVVGLAHQLLGAPIPSALRGLPGITPPGWLVEFVLWRWGGGNTGKWRERRLEEWWPYIAFHILNPVRWAYRLGLPPVRFLPPLWAASLLGRLIQPFPRLWRKLFVPRSANVFDTHTSRTF